MNYHIEEVILDTFKELNVEVLDYYEETERNKVYLIVKTELERVANIKDVVEHKFEMMKRVYEINFTMHEMSEYYRFWFWENEE